MTGSFPVADHLRCLASASADILTDIPFSVTAFWDRTLLGVARMEGHPVYLNTSCAVSFALGMSDFLQTWRPPVRKVRCEPANCPEQQRARCFSQTLNRIPSAETIARISDYLAVPEGFVHWNELCQSITVET